jgi:predicted kinase
MWNFNHTPEPPGFSVPWNDIRRFPWIAAMEGVEQNPAWHAEGDVLIHTQMVAQAMAELPQFRAASRENQHILFAAALLHDVAKPQCTRFIDGHWSSPKHTVVGERLARTVLWREFGPLPFRTREAIAKLVRYHGLPLLFLNQPDPARAIIEASQEVDLSLLAVLALADVAGRCCPGRQQMIDTVNMFLEFAAEIGCAPKYPFASNLHRFMYSVGHKPLDYIPYDVTWGEVILMCGPPGSGKSTVASQIAAQKDMPILALDDYRERMGIDAAEGQGPVVDACERDAIALLRAKKPFIWDATNLFRDIRSSLVALFAKYGASVRIVYVEAPTWRDMFSRNAQRSRRVPEAVLAKMAENLEMPSLNEAHVVEYCV